MSKVLKSLPILAVVLGVLFLMRTRSGDITSVEAHRLVEAGATLLDVRTPDEFTSGHLPGALNIPVQSLADRVVDLGAKTHPVVVYCRTGNRSRRALSILKDAGFTQVHNLGAIGRW